VQTSATGNPVCRAIPRAKNAADRSSKIGIASIKACWAKAIANGADRDPGQITAVVKPSRLNVSPKIEAQTVFLFVKSIDDMI
jgi:hypothetical protein